MCFKLLPFFQTRQAAALAASSAAEKLAEVNSVVINGPRVSIYGSGSYKWSHLSTVVLEESNKFRQVALHSAGF